MNSLHSIAAALAFSIAVSGCGGGGDDDEDDARAPVGPGWSVPPSPGATPVVGATIDGVFRDAVVEGLDYSDGGALSGITGPTGNFQYAQGNTVTFRIGGLTLGSVGGQPFMSPLHLIGSTTNITQSINNRLRLLQMLDIDGNPDNGILISNATRAVATSWTTPDFTLADAAFDSAIASIRQDAINADQGTHAIPTAAVASAHFVRTAWCAYNGLYRGTFAGGDSGVFAIAVYGQGGLMFGGAYSNVDRTGFEVTKQTASGLAIFPSFVTGQVSGGATFTGAFPTPDRMSGTWSSPPDSGTFLGGRAFGSSSAKYRITGYQFPVGTALLVALEVDAANQVTGQIIDRDYLRTAEPVSLTGSLSGTTLTAAAANNLYTINGTFNTANPAALALSGQLRDNVKGRDVSLSLPACKLN